MRSARRTVPDVSGTERHPLPAGGKGRRATDDFGIDIAFERFAGLVETLHGDQPARNADLRRGDSDTFVGRIPHGEQHALLSRRKYSDLSSSAPSGAAFRRRNSESARSPIRHKRMTAPLCEAMTSHSLSVNPFWTAQAASRQAQAITSLFISACSVSGKNTKIYSPYGGTPLRTEKKSFPIPAIILYLPP